MAKRVLIRGGDPESIRALHKALGQLPRNLEPMRAAKFRNLRYHIDELGSRLQQHLSEYLAGDRTRTNVEWWLKREIRDRYKMAFLEGKEAGGSYSDLDEWDKRELTRLRRSQFQYLRGFLDDIDAKQGTMPYARRMQMYADALSAVFALGFVRSNRSNRRRIKWHRVADDSCDTCLGLENRIWTPRAFLRWYRQNRILPGINTDCLSNCRCYLEDFFV